MLRSHHTPSLSWLQQLKQAITGASKICRRKNHNTIQPMAFMLDETLAYKPERKLNVQAVQCTRMKHAIAAHAPQPVTSKTTPAQTIHKALRGKPSQICAELDNLVAQEALQQSHI